LGLVVMLFFAWGFLTAINDILLPHLKSLFDLSYVEAGLVQFCFFAAYGLLGIPSGVLMERLGHRRGIVLALLVMALGCLLFLPASRLGWYPLFLGALFVLAGGIVVLQTAANPYVALLGPEETAASRLNLSQAFNSLGHTLAPSLGAWLLLRDAAEQSPEELAAALRGPYTALALALLALGLIFALLPLPGLHTGAAPGPTSEPAQAAASAGSAATPATAPAPGARAPFEFSRPLRLGIVAIFLYVGAEVSIGSFLVNYFGTERLGALSAERAGYLVSFYWLGAMIGRFAGSALNRLIKPQRLLLIHALAAMLLLALTMGSSGTLAMVAVLGIGLFNSIMFPNIFTLALTGQGEHSSRAAGWLVMAIVGGAILPLLQGWSADHLGIAASFLVPMAAYAYVAYYGWKGYLPRAT
jgi:FHS family L-fucose permease-like MFS transporter